MIQSTEKPTKGIQEMEERIPEWVRDMQAYRSEHGYFRPTDVLRVLGDPEKRVELPAMQELAAAKVADRK
jgi:hypothetical protein